MPWKLFVLIRVERMMRQSKCYSELIALKTFEERLEYLKTASSIGSETFGSRRQLNQILYRSSVWRAFRNKVILRDLGCDLGVPGYEIPAGALIHIHHINEVTIEQILDRDPIIFDLENVITTTDQTHRAIHYMAVGQTASIVLQRKPNDTCPWKV